MKKQILEFKPTSANQIMKSNGYALKNLSTKEEKALQKSPYFKKNKILVRPYYHENYEGKKLMFLEWKLKKGESLFEGKKIIALDITKELNKINK